MPRKLFCQISPLTYQISTWRCIAQRCLRDAVSGENFAKVQTEEKLPVLVYRHKSLIRRQLGNVDMTLQENKAVNLALAVPCINGILVRPGEVFSFWRLVGDATAARGFRPGLTIEGGHPSSGTGGGLCQFTNLLHWMALHSELTIWEHHHHDGVDLFPDYGRQIPFGTGTSILYNYLDYRLKNGTDNTYQFLVYTTEKYLCGELRAAHPQPYRYHIHAVDEHFTREDGIVYRNGEVWREQIDPRTGNCMRRERLRKNHARVLYDTASLPIRECASCRDI